MYADIGDLAQAEGILRESLAIDRRVLGNDNEDMPISINNLATILVDEGKCSDAIPLHEESLALRHRFYGEPSAEVATALGNYARALDCAGRYAEAEVAADSALAMCTTVFGRRARSHRHDARASRGSAPAHGATRGGGAARCAAPSTTFRASANASGAWATRKRDWAKCCSRWDASGGDRRGDDGVGDSRRDYGARTTIAPARSRR